jgi:hypothetical protein
VTDECQNELSLSLLSLVHCLHRCLARNSLIQAQEYCTLTRNFKLAWPSSRVIKVLLGNHDVIHVRIQADVVRGFMPATCRQRCWEAHTALLC